MKVFVSYAQERFVIKKTQEFLTALYDDTVESLDMLLASFVRSLKSAQVWGDSLVIFTSDHGEALGEHQVFLQHGHSLANHMLHVPLLIHDASMKISSSDNLVGHVDLFPTILDVLEMPPKSLQGISLTTAPTNAARSLLAEINFPHVDHYTLMNSQEKTLVSVRDAWVVSCMSLQMESADLSQFSPISRIKGFARGFFSPYTAQDVLGVVKESREWPTTEIVAVSPSLKAQLAELGYL